MKPVMLMILDGWGIAPAGPYNAAKTAKRRSFPAFLKLTRIQGFWLPAMR